MSSLKQMHERFDEKFPWLLDSDHSGLAEDVSEHVKLFIESEIQLALAEREQEIIWMIEDLRGFPACVLSEEQAKEIIDLITKEE